MVIIKGGMKRLIKSCLGCFGYELRRPKDAFFPPPDVLRWVRDTQNIHTIVDIGANDGEFAAFLASFFQASSTFVFEPLPSCAESLRAKANSIPNFHVFKVALSDRPGRECLYANSHPPSSSLLRVSEVHRREFPGSQGETQVLVPVCVLDDLLDPDVLEKNLLVKVDVEGLEERVLRGGQRVFRAAQCVLIEMSFVPMHEGQPLFDDVHSPLVKLGFRFGGIRNQIASSESGQPLFAHCLYVRSDPPAGDPA